MSEVGGWEDVQGGMCVKAELSLEMLALLTLQLFLHLPPSCHRFCSFSYDQHKPLLWGCPESCCSQVAQEAESQRVSSPVCVCMREGGREGGREERREGGRVTAGLRPRSVSYNGCSNPLQQWTR